MNTKTMVVKICIQKSFPSTTNHQKSLGQIFANFHAKENATSYMSYRSFSFFFFFSSTYIVYLIRLKKIYAWELLCVILLCLWISTLHTRVMLKSSFSKKLSLCAIATRASTMLHMLLFDLSWICAHSSSSAQAHINTHTFKHTSTQTHTQPCTLTYLFNLYTVHPLDRNTHETRTPCKKRERERERAKCANTT